MTPLRALPGAIAQAVARRVAEVYHRVVSGPGQFRCGVCGRRVRAFLPLSDAFVAPLREAGWPYGLDRAETCNAPAYSCPHCGAADRDRLMALYLREHLRALPAGATVIDFAPAPALSRFLRRELRSLGRGTTYRTADLSGVGVDDRVDITDMPLYATGSVDLFLCSHVLEHVTDDRAAMRELLRILKPGGRGLLLVPIVLGLEAVDEDPTVTDPKERWRRFGQGDHVRLYSKAGFTERLREAGFVVHEFGADAAGAGAFEQQGISPRSVLYAVEKPGPASTPPHRGGPRV